MNLKELSLRLLAKNYAEGVSAPVRLMTQKTFCIRHHVHDKQLETP